jgi:hypothetical protein
VTVGGTAELSRRGAPAWQRASLRDEVDAGDGARTAGGRLTLRTASGQSVRLAPRSQVFVLDGGGAGPIRLRLDTGRIWVAVTPNAVASNQIEVRAGPAAVLVRNGGAAIAMNADGSISIGVSHGAATCSGSGWERSLAEGQELVVPAAGAPKEPAKLKRDKRDVDWLKWNELQDVAGGYGGPRPE